MTAERAARRATYRVQMHAGFTFADAEAVTGYLADLGVSHLYLSPILQAAPGSTHGYDVVDPTRVNRELGGEAGYAALGRALGDVGLGQLLDIVPNHMAVIGRDNAWWWDVLENGPSSVYASYFDVDWDPPESKLRNTVLLAILGDHYGRELEAGHLRVDREAGSFVLRYFDHAAPLAPRSLDTLLLRAAARLAGAGDGAGPEVVDAAGELESVATAFGRLPHSTSTDRASVRERHRDKEILRARLAELCGERPALAEAVDAEVAALNADLDALDALLERQNFRLAWWRTAGEELDYRRFFDINDLAGIRVEDPAVFTDSHALILSWLRDGVLDGVRIDHVDGLADPATYLDRLAGSAPEAWIVVEKIIEGEERLPAGWPVAGTTGYDWLNVVGGVLTEPDGATTLTRTYEAYTGSAERFEEVVRRAKEEILAGPLAADLNRLVAELAAVCERHRRYRDYTRRDLRSSLREILVGFTVYRTYVQPGQAPSAADVAVVEAATLMAGIRRPDVDEELLSFLRDLLLGRVEGEPEAAFCRRFQQLSGPVMAKAVEDTSFYRFVPVTWLNEVGGDPGRVGVALDRFHRVCAENQTEHPDALLALSTHDTKRSEDVRARLSVLAEVPEQWQSAVTRWRDANAERDAPPPDRSTEWLLYQSLVGAWPISTERLQGYMEKATREAKVHTSWTDPEPVFDESLKSFIAQALADESFTSDVDEVVAAIRRPGWAVSLALKLLTLTAPGVPDLYQGTECWDLSLVDPDNRRPVDYALRRSLLSGLAGRTAASVWAGESGDGVTKLAVVSAALGLRREHPEWFGPGPAGAYDPLSAVGPAADHVVGFLRGGRAATLVTRWPALLERRGGWGDTVVTLPEGRWTDRMSGRSAEGTLRMDDALADLPVALLVREG